VVIGEDDLDPVPDDVDRVRHARDSTGDPWPIRIRVRPGFTISG
jgi:hypothetical protein